MSLHGKKTGNPTAKSNRSARRRDREKRGASVRALTLDQLWVRDSGRCYLCALPVARSQASKEHVIPLEAGGTDRPGNTKLAHKRCNSKKGRKTAAQLRKARKRKGLRRRPFKRKAKPIEERVADRRDSGTLAPSLLPCVDEVPKEELF